MASAADQRPQLRKQISRSSADRAGAESEWQQMIQKKASASVHTPPPATSAAVQEKLGAISRTQSREILAASSSAGSRRSSLVLAAMDEMVQQVIQSSRPNAGAKSRDNRSSRGSSQHSFAKSTLSQSITIEGVSTNVRKSVISIAESIRGFFSVPIGQETAKSSAFSLQITQTPDVFGFSQSSLASFQRRSQHSTTTSAQQSVWSVAAAKTMTSSHSLAADSVQGNSRSWSRSPTTSIMNEPMSGRLLGDALEETSLTRTSSVGRERSHSVDQPVEGQRPRRRSQASSQDNISVSRAPKSRDVATRSSSLAGVSKGYRYTRSPSTNSSEESLGSSLQSSLQSSIFDSNGSMRPGSADHLSGQQCSNQQHFNHPRQSTSKSSPSGTQKRGSYTPHVRHSSDSVMSRQSSVSLSGTKRYYSKYEDSDVRRGSKLRTEVKSDSGSSSAIHLEIEDPNGEVLQQYQELQKQYLDLQMQYKELQKELHVQETDAPPPEKPPALQRLKCKIKTFWKKYFAKPSAVGAAPKPGAAERNPPYGANTNMH
ncbi:uncharacterized protein BJ171DRAFT_475152 [Polychytrium aggregatum]|uniref:uncharacterized protein n=1 Tax=Polychytrium aggregatum TaxID=110093 RepID=UPI0022FEB8DB|nr:uncharacterized protein BJ171DRAFT_475152 [Polychytrium aggregatum]KAI9204165.1 hypothetical protein BJ171DRAFT_475152 [Polychytrium aggregatum]